MERKQEYMDCKPRTSCYLSNDTEKEGGSERKEEGGTER